MPLQSAPAVQGNNAEMRAAPVTHAVTASTTVPAKKFQSTLVQRLGARSAQGVAGAIVPGRFVMTLKDYWSRALPVTRAANAAMGGSPLYAQKSRGHAKSPECQKAIDGAIDQACQTFRVPKKLLNAVIHAESAFNPQAVSPVGAKGLMQLMDATARSLGVRNSFDINENVMGGARYLRQMLDKFGQDPRLALAAYNAGPGAVQKYNGVPPYRETQNYVQKIMREYLTT